MKNKNIIIYNICLCSCGSIASGGEKFTHEVILRWAKNYLNINYFGYNSFSQRWSLQNKNLRSINLFKTKKYFKGRFVKFRILLLYFLIFLKSLKLIKKFDQKEKNIIISHSDAWPDTLFSFLLKLRNRDAYWIAINHMVLPSPWKGYKYVYTKSYKIPSLIDLYQWLNQRIFFLLQKRANLLVSINSNDREYLLRKNKNVLIIKHGREYVGQPELDLNNKIYDICFLGRFYDQKGIDEIPDILANLRKIHDKKITVILIGAENDYSARLKQEFKKGDLMSRLDIKFLGPKYGDEKYDFLKKSRAFLFPSYFESFGIVYLDAISVGTPVVEYDLPCYEDHKYGVIKVPFKDNNAFAQAIKRLLEDQEYYKKLAYEGYNYSREFDWDKTAESFEKYFLEYADRD